MESEEKLEFCYGFAAAEFLEEEIELLHLEGTIPKDHPFIAKGKYIEDKTKAHPHQWWAPQSAIDDLNRIYAEQSAKEDE